MMLMALEAIDCMHEQPGSSPEPNLLFHVLRQLLSGAIQTTAVTCGGDEYCTALEHQGYKRLQSVQNSRVSCERWRLSHASFVKR
jgi:hypothetical protein